MKQGMVIAIDGPSGAGKSTVARLLAERLGYIYIDTGAMYRGIGWCAKRAGVDPLDEQALASLCARTEVAIRKVQNELRILVNGVDVTGEIRTPEMGMMASTVSKSPAVRARLLIFQRELGRNGGVVMDGRDIGTVVFPGADVKFFLDAGAEERGKRRWLELKANGMHIDLGQITEEIRARDRQDTERAIAPLRRAEDAFLIDSSCMTIDAVVQKMLTVVSERT